MEIIKGGIFNGIEFTCMYDVHNITVDYTKRKGGQTLHGLMGIANTLNDAPSILWFDENMNFVEGNLLHEMTKSYASELFLKNYVEKIGITHICKLFTKDTLIEFTSDGDWEWSIKDEMEINHCSEEEAQKKTYEWFLSMSNLDLWQERISDGNKRALIEQKAEELGFEYELIMGAK